MEPGGAARDGRDERRLDAFCHRALEAVDHRAEREPAGAEHLEHQLLLALADERLRERDGSRGQEPVTADAGTCSSQ